MYIGYFDEFGHNGAYVGRYDSSYKTHPVFGLGGFIIPADKVRALTGVFRKIKESGLKEEIAVKVLAKGKKVEHWEKKGSALLTTTNINKYRETRRIINRVISLLDRLGAQVVFYGQEKPRGGPTEISDTNADRYDHAMKQLIKRIHWDLPEDENFLMVLDKQGDRERLEIFAGSASFMFSHQDAVRLLEPPMEVESHLYYTVQCADWICGLLGRIAAYKFDPDFSEFDWAPKYFGKRLAKVTSDSSKLLGYGKGSRDVYKQHLNSFGTCYDSRQIPA
ncbi:MAG: DUF3800 domain-containing protein [Micrococcaceae bacterium]